MSISEVILLTGGLLCFLYGMYEMTEGFQKAAGHALEKSLRTLLKNPGRGFLLGVLFTSILQSSSVVTVMLVSLVQARVIPFTATLGVILGADLGTTVTAWLLSWIALEGKTGGTGFFSAQTIPLLLLLIGVSLRLPCFRRARGWEKVFLGLGILWCGMQSMSGAVQPLVRQPEFLRFLMACTHPWISVAVGIAFTGVIQSSSAGIGVLQAMSFTGAVSADVALPLILGMNIGTCATAFLASIGTHREAQRVAVLHILIKIAGAGLGMLLFFLGKGVLRNTVWMQPVGPVQIAMMHTGLNLFMIAGVFPFYKGFLRWAERIRPEKKAS